MRRNIYTVEVLLTRYLSEDQEISQERFPNISLHEALRKQVRAELQGAHEHGLIAGFSEIGAVNLKD